MSEDLEGRLSRVEGQQHELTLRISAAEAAVANALRVRREAGSSLGWLRGLMRLGEICAVLVFVWLHMSRGFCPWPFATLRSVL